jgi:hypothetical protein
MTTVLKSSGPISAQQMVNAPHCEVGLDWHGHPLHGAFRWSLASDAERFWVSLELPAPPPARQMHRSGEFVEALSEADVVECFLMDPSGCYQEWNISPDGAWWAMSFRRYRQRDPKSVRPGGVSVQVFRERDRWRAILSVPIRQLSVELNQDTRVHLSGILYGPHGAPTFISSATSPGFEPDFHDARCFDHVRFASLEVS